MFHLFKKKKVDTGKITDFNDAINAINVFMLLSEWNKAKNSLNEVKNKEMNGYNKLISDLEKQEDKEGADKEKRTQLEIYKKKVNKLKVLEGKLDASEKKYNEKIQTEKFQVRFKKIKTELAELIGNNRNDQAMNLLQNFLEDNKDNDSVISFFNKEKKLIHKNIEKVKKTEDEKTKQNARLEAMKLIGGNVNFATEEDDEGDERVGVFKKWMKKINFYKKLKEQIKRKQLLDEINILIEEDSKVKNDMAAKKLANIHRGLIKEINNDSMIGYELYGKILGADKISGDTFGFNEEKDKYNFFLGDATGHGIRAGFIITLLSRLFNKYVGKSNLQELTFQINNGLKQDLKSRNFITGIFFEIEKENSENISFVGMGHEPMLIFRHKDKTIEKVVPGGLAAGIRLIKNKEDVRVKNLSLDDNDVLLIYSDGIIENKSEQGDFYGMDRLQANFLQAAMEEGNIHKLYDQVMEKIKDFRGGSHFDDDTSVLIVKRDTNKDIVEEDSEYLQEIGIKEGLKKNEVKKLEGKNKEQIEKELEAIRKEKETERIVKILETLYYTGEILKLKQEAIRYIKEGYIHKKINFFLRKAIDNEKKYKIDQKEQKVKNKYNVLKELLNKGDYKTVIQETEEIISKDGSI